MRFLTIAILSISLTATAAEPKRQGAETQPVQEESAVREAQPEQKAKASRKRRFFSSVGSFSAGMLLSDPYQEVRSSKKSAIASEPRKQSADQ